MTNKGFTLIEILITIAIISIIGATAMYAINPFEQIMRGQDGVRRADLSKLKVAFESYYEDHGCYPNPNILKTCGAKTLAPYIDVIPCDPTTKKAYTLYTKATEASCPQNFVIYAKLASYFNPTDTKAPSCTDTTTAHSAGVEAGDVARGCGGLTVCAKWYGCVQGACQQIAEDDIAPCGPAYCINNNCVGNACCFGIDCSSFQGVECVEIIR